MKRPLLILFFLAPVITALSWIYPEHRDITILAIQKLNPARRDALERLWTIARTGHEKWLSPVPADTMLAKKTRYLDYASFPAIAGDHSTSSLDMMSTILGKEWIWKVSDVAFDLKKGLATARNRSERINRLRDSDLRMLKVDPEYVSRAGANNVHFMLARPAVDTDMASYLNACREAGAEVSAPGAYWWYHLSALLKAAEYASDPNAAHAPELLLSALADESFALHFLEDMFASGHVAGTRGNAAQRKGTHDYYDEKGLEVSTWEGERLVLMGDAFMRPRDAERAAKTVSISLQQVIDAASGNKSLPVRKEMIQPEKPDTFNVAKLMSMPDRAHEPATTELFAEVFLTTVMPGLAKGDGELPRFRSELGPFVGLSAAARANFLPHGFHPDQNAAGEISGVEMNFRVGLGLEGVLNEAGDGMLFIDAGFRLDGSSTMKLSPNPELQQFGNIASAIPYRSGLHLRLRMPFYLLPGDLIILAPLLSVISPKAMNTVVATAGNGGLIPWQSGLLTPIGRFQFVLGREAGVYLFGSQKQPDHFIVPYTDGGKEEQAVISLRSVQLEFPVMEYRPFHTFSTDQTASLMIQLFGGVDIPYDKHLVTPAGINVPPVRAIPFFGLRAVFDWRYYFSGE